MRISHLTLLTFVALFSLSSAAFDWKPTFPEADIDAMLHWGTYKSDRVHGITELTDPLDSLTVSLMYATDMTTNNASHLKYNFVDVQSPSDDESQVYYEYHNGLYFAQQAVEDHNSHVNLTNTFFKTAITTEKQAWRSLTTVNEYTGPTNSTPEYVTLFYGIALENYYNNSTRYLDFDPTHNQVNILQASEADYLIEDASTGFINYYIYNANGQPIQGDVQVFYTSLSGINQADLWQLPNQTVTALSNSQTSDYFNLNNAVDPNTKATVLVLLQFKVPANQGFSFLVTYNSDKPTNTAPLWALLQSIIAGYRVQYLSQFSEEFPNVDGTHLSLAKYAINNLLGGIIYYYGAVNITEDPTPQPALPLFTATPTRNSFERGFLWDEGFHELLICKWNPDLCVEIITSWMGTQYKTGWIPREQARGAEILSFVPGAFVAQSDKEGNPPTLMMALQYLLTNPNVNQTLKDDVYQGLKEPLFKWWNWFYTSQQVYDTNGTGLNMFIWSYKVFEGNIQYFGSGLDDYPRSDPGYISKFHLDLHVWEILFSDVMGIICSGAGDTANATFFEGLSKTLRNNIPLFLDPSDALFKDIFQPNNTNITNPADTPSVPSSHVGYVSLMPLMFGLVAADSTAFNATLDLLDSAIPGVMWSQYGIISLAKNDSAFEKNSDYWTGPIWINFQYLLLRAFKLYYWEAPRVQTIYRNIRADVIGTITNNYVDTGYIWEHYNLTTGLGQGNHPFTGWSTVVNFILTEDY